VPSKALNSFQSFWGGRQFLVAERKDVEDCLAGRVEGAVSGEVCVHEVKARVLTVPRPDIGVSPGGEPVEVAKHLLWSDNCRAGQE